jgi:hypothetical protein
VFLYTSASNRVSEQNSYRWCPAVSRVDNDLQQWGWFEINGVNHPVADTMEIAIMDVIQARRYFAQEFVEWVESLHLPIKKEHHIIGHVVGQLYRLEQELLARLGLVTD